MKYLAILLVSVIGLAAADYYGEYVPRAFFIIDENGNPSPARPINPEVLSRARRQIQPIQPFGNQPFGFQPFPFPAVPIAGQGQGTFTSSSQTLSSRFGEDEPISQGQSTIITSNNGQYQQHTTHLRPDGSVTHNKQSGRVKRQQNQLQSQDNKGGQQLQSQSQNQPGGHQNQQQSQGQNIPNNQQHSPQGNPSQSSQGNQNNHPQGSSQGGQQYAPDQQYQQGSQPPHNSGGQQQYPSNNGGQQQYPSNNGQGYNQYPQGQQQQGGFPFAPFGFGSFGPAGFPQFGANPAFGGPGFGFGAPPGFPQAGFAVPIQPIQPGPGRLDSRFSDDDGGSTSGGTQTFTSQNGVFHSTSSVLGPDGKVHTRHQSGRHY